MENIQQFLGVNSDNIGQVIEQLVNQEVIKRRKYERRWYDNQFFDDGYHFRVISRKTGRVIDTIGKMTGYVERAIPRASQQIRGVSNLLWSAKPYPVVYPERITIEDFRLPNGQVDMQAYMQAVEKSKQVARKQGKWLTTEWEEADLSLKIIDMMIIAAKQSISYLQVYSDPVTKQIKFDVFDAFDVITEGDKRSLKDVPFITKTKSTTIDAIQSNPMYKPEMIKKLQPDNKYATSEIKDAYMRARFGSKTGEKQYASVIEKETFIKERLSDENWKRAIKLDAGGALEGKSKGDTIMRHVFSAGGITLQDEYINYDEYPFAYFRFEPGPLYQTPLIERFIPQNKSLDVIMTRLEKWVNTMVVGIYQKRKGENFQVSNFSGGQVVEYETTPLTQMQNSTVGATPFSVIQLLDKYIEEQGASTSALGQTPAGVKSGVAIESLKASEYANLKIATQMLKKTIKTIADLMLERADKDFMEPKEVSYIEDSEPQFFDIIGNKGFELSQTVGKALPPTIIPIKKGTKVRIEIEPGLGLTMDGKRNSMQQIIEFMLKFSEVGAVNPEAIKVVMKKFLDTFGFGSTQEFMEAMEQGNVNDMTEEQIMKMKVAIVEAMKDAGVVGPEADQKLVDSTKVGVVEALKDTGMLDKQNAPQAKEPSKSISFKDLPAEGQAQLAAQAGIQLSPEQIKVDQAKKQVQNIKNANTPAV